MQGVKNIALNMARNPSCKPPPQLGAPLVGCCHSEDQWDWEGCVPLHLPALSSLILWGLHLNLLPTRHGSLLPPSPSTIMVPNSPIPRLHFKQPCQGEAYSILSPQISWLSFLHLAQFQRWKDKRKSQVGQSPLEKAGTWTIRSLTSVPNIIPIFIFVPVPPFQHADSLK